MLVLHLPYATQPTDSRYVGDAGTPSYPPLLLVVSNVRGAFYQ